MKTPIIIIFGSVLFAVLPIILAELGDVVAMIKGCAIQRSSIDYVEVFMPGMCPEGYINLLHRSAIFVIFTVPIAVIPFIIGLAMLLYRSVKSLDAA